MEPEEDNKVKTPATKASKKNMNWLPVMKELKKDFENQVREVEEKLEREMKMMQENHEKLILMENENRSTELLFKKLLEYCHNLSIWMKYYGSDPRIALGRYSPLEKEIMRLGGVHTIATRRLLAQKHREEEKMLKELRQKSPDYQKAMEYKKEHPLLNTGKKSMEKVWTARIIIPREELKVPAREEKTINKHIERMKLGRGLQDWSRSKQFQNSSFLPAVTPDSKPASQERDEEKETSKANKTEIKMKVIFKADGPKKTIISNPNDRQTFDVRTKLERNIAGHTNRTRFLPTDFPGDLLFLNQNYKSTRIHLKPKMKLFLLNNEGRWKSCLQYPFEDSPHS